MVSNLKVDNIQATGGTATAISLADDGTSRIEKVPHWKLVHSEAGVNVSSGSWTEVSLDTAQYDSHNLKINSTIVITSATAGLYHLTGHIRMGNRYINRLIVKITLGATDISQFEGTAGGNGTGAYMSVETNTIHRLSDGDILKMWVYHDYGSNVGVLGSTQGHESWFSGYRITA